MGGYEWSSSRSDTSLLHTLSCDLLLFPLSLAHPLDCPLHAHTHTHTHTHRYQVEDVDQDADQGASRKLFNLSPADVIELPEPNAPRAGLVKNLRVRHSNNRLN